jgi:hypothetical protein
MRTEKLNSLQQEFLMIWKDHNYCGTMLVATGFGKSFLSLKGILLLLENGKINKGDTVWILAETTARKHTYWNDELPKFKEITGYDILSLVDFQFHCYQSRPKGTPKFIIYDEIEECVSDKYQEVLKIDCYKLGLSATVPEVLSVYRNRIPEGLMNKIKQSDKFTRDKVITDFINKGQLLEMYCPIIVEYDIDKGIADNILSPYETWVIDHKLDNTNKYLPLFKKNPRLVTELDYYNARQSIVKNFNQPIVIKKAMSKQLVSLLYDLRSKKRVARHLINSFRQSSARSMVCSVELDPIRSLVDEIAEDSTKYFVTPNGEEKRLITDINKVKDILCSDKKILKSGNYLGGSLEVVKRTIEDILLDPPQIIGTSKKFKRGVTIPNLHHLLIFSYYTSYHHLMQYIGRIVRYEEGKVGKVFIFRTLGTYEENWFEKMNKVYDKNLNQIDEIDLKIKGYISSSNYE